MDENQLSNIVIGCALDVHTALGPGLLENTYQECLFYKINQMAQVMTYLKLSKLKLGLLMNFNEIRLKNGIKRVALNL